MKKETLKSPIMVSRVYSTEFDKEGTMTAELKQMITTKSFYPSKKVSNSIQDNIFEIEDFGFEEQVFENVETRVAWIAVPLDSNPGEVSQKLKTFEKSNIYKILSNHPILTTEDEFAIEDPALSVTKDTFANKQAVRYPPGHPSAGHLIYDKYGKVQYRRTAFSKDGKEDLDLRTSNTLDRYLSPELEQELNTGSKFFVIPDQRI